MKISKQQIDFEKLVDFEKQGLLYDLILKKSDLAIKAITLEGIITSWNEGAETMYGYTAQEIIGENISLFIPPTQENELILHINNLVLGKIVNRYITKRIRKDGVAIDVSLYMSLITDMNGQAIGVSTIDRDVTYMTRASDELISQNKQKEKLASNLVIADIELAYQDREKTKRSNELVIANKELLFQNEEKEKRAGELIIANKELLFQESEKGKRAKENKDLAAFSSKQTLASQYARSLIEASRDPLFTIDVSGKIMDLNQASIDVTGLKRKALIGSDFAQYFTVPHKARLGYSEIFKNGFVVDYPLTIKDPKLTDVLFNGSIYKNEQGEVLGAVVVARDITEQKIIEKELIEAKVFAEMATSIAESAKFKAEEAVKSKQQFLSNMSHEIRTPMNAIIGFTKVVLKTDLSADQKEYLMAIKMSGDALIVLINDILDLAKVDAGKMTFEKTPFQMETSISAMLHIFDSKVQEKNLKLIKHYDPNIPNILVGDAVRLHQILLNLLSNAVKFTQEGTIIVDVILKSENADNATIQFSVTDTGIGIDKVKIPTIFENFQQATSSTSRLFGGTGLGLAIVKQLVEAQGGAIEVRSQLKKGSVFSFTLNFAKTTQEAVIDVDLVAITKPTKNIKVLVVEDMALNQLLMKTLLDDFGFESDICENGKLAVEKLATKSFDIILMDLQMPVMNGFEATSYIRNTLKLTIPIIALTADVTTMDVEKCIAIGMDDYLSKPVDERELYSKMLTIIKETKSNKQIKKEKIVPIVKVKYTDLQYLYTRTKSNPVLMSEMISAYLEQTPPLIKAMKLSCQNQDWGLLYTTVHKLLPSFSIMGFHTDFVTMAKNIQDFSGAVQEIDRINEMVETLEAVLTQSLVELNQELEEINNRNAK